MKRITIIGSTGSIGTQALSVIRNHSDFVVSALACGHNVALLERQIREFHPKCVCVADEEAKRDLLPRIRDLRVDVLCGMDGLVSVASETECDIVLTAIVGMAGIRPTISAILAGRDIALANKETLVCAGHLIMPLAKQKGVQILPVDSEHSAIFQSLQGNENNSVSRILLTASGGPFRGKKKNELETVTIEDALAHPNWSMGAKITIDSATMVNKGLEVIEASYLFGIAQEKIEVIVHPQSIIHSAVEYVDGAVIAQLGLPDMKLPIQYALCFPQRRKLEGDACGQRLDLFSVASLTFERPDEETFCGLRLAREAFSKGGNLPTIFNAANEAAVSLFLQGKIPFLGIVEQIEKAMQKITYIDSPDLDAILETERQVRDLIV